MNHPTAIGGVLAATLACSLASSIAAQCDLQWQPGARVPATNHQVHAVAPLPGGGFVAAGWFDIAGDTLASRVARWDGSAWHPLGAGVDGAAEAVVVLPNGDVVVGGTFAAAGGNPAPFVARWNGSVWSPLGAGLDGPVHALAVAANGDVLAGGAFGASGGQPVGRLARFDGTTWSAAGAPITQGIVLAIEVMPNGAIAVGGQGLESGSGGFTAAIASGGAWQSLGAAVPTPTLALRALPNGHLAIGGGRLTVLNDNVAIFDGTSLQTLVTPLNIRVYALLVDASGELVIGGTSTGSAGALPTVARRTPTGWQVLLNSTYTTFALTLQNGRIVAAGGPIYGSPVIEPTVREWQGTGWVGLGGEAAQPIAKVEAGRNGELFVAGSFTQLGGVAVHNVAQRAGASWAPLGLGVDGQVTAAEADGAGGLVVAGSFTLAGGAPANRIARWNGTSWSTLGNGFAAVPYALAAGPGQRVVAAVEQRLHVFANGVWTTLPQLTPTGVDTSVATLADGGIVALNTQLPYVRRWDGSTWTGMPLPPQVRATAIGTGENGDVFVASYFPALPIEYSVSRWTGSAWQMLGARFNGQILGLEPLPNGDLVAHGFFTAVGTTPAPAIARWDGSAWRGVDGGLAGSLVSAIGAGDVAMTTTGELFAVGSFATAGSQVSARIARAVSPCPASATTFGAGCFGSAGPLALTATTLPFAGATFRSRATGFPALALAVHVVGTSAVVAPLPLGAPGCALFTSLDAIDVLLPANGVVEPSFVVPRDPALVGATARTQVIGIELDASLAIVRTTATNALVLTVGAY